MSGLFVSGAVAVIGAGNIGARYRAVGLTLERMGIVGVRPEPFSTFVIVGS